MVQNAVVDVQTMWEVAYLLELWSKSIPAEIPQALLVNPSGTFSLVVRRLDEQYTSHRGETYAELLERIKNNTKLQPIDATEYNTIRDGEGKLHIIDTNQWQWPPYTDDYTTALLNTVQEAIHEMRKKEERF